MPSEHDPQLFGGRGPEFGAGRTDAMAGGREETWCTGRHRDDPDPTLEGALKMRKFFELGGLVAALVLIGFGVAAIVVSADGRNEVQTALKQQKVVGTPDMTPSAISAEASQAGLNPATLELPTCTAANKAVESGT